MSEVWATCLVAAAIAVVGYLFKSNKDDMSARQDAFQEGMQKSLDVIAQSLAGVQQAVNNLSMHLGGYVQKSDCTTDMGDHCKRLNSLQEEVKDNTQRIATMEASMKIYHNHKD